MKQEARNQLANNEKMKSKQPYTAPAVEVIEMENEGVIAASSTYDSNGGLGNFGNGGDIFNSSASQRRGYSSASELEDMINDILTFEE